MKRAVNRELGVYQGAIKSSRNTTLHFCACDGFTAIGVNQPEDIEQALQMLWARIKDPSRQLGMLVLPEDLKFPQHLEGWKGASSITVHSTKGRVEDSILKQVKIALTRRDKQRDPATEEPEDALFLRKIPASRLVS